MSTVEATTVEAIRSMTNKEMVIAIIELQTQVKALMEKAPTSTTPSSKEMTVDDARSILIGDLKDASHKDAAAKLGLSYGQIYSCRGEFTFKQVHKELKNTEGYKNKWIKV